MSFGPFGTVFGFQFAAVFQSPLIGLALHVALPAETALSSPSERMRTIAQEIMGDFMAEILPIAAFKSQADSSRRHDVIQVVVRAY